MDKRSFIEKFFDKVFSFTRSRIKRHIKRVFGEEDFKKISFFIEKHWLFFFVKSFFHFIILFFIGLIIYLYFLGFAYFIKEMDALKDFIIYINTFFILFMSFFVINSLKNIYNVLVDYRNDYVVAYDSGIYVSNKNGILYQSGTKIPFINVQSIKGKEENFIQLFFGYGTLSIKTVKNMDDINFAYCKNMQEAVKGLQSKHTDYISMLGKKGLTNQENA